MENKEIIKPKWYKKIYDAEVTELDGKSCLFSNMKFILILFVVIGHFTECAVKSSDIAYTIRTFIYTFHMPAFIFISGYFSKKCATSIEKNVNKVLSLSIIYIVCEILWYIIRWIARGFSDVPKFSFISADRGLWYLMFLIMATLVLPFFSKFKPQIVLVLLFIMGLWIGNEDKVGHYMNSSRFFVFIIFFVIGYFFSYNNYQKLRKPIVQLCSWIYMLSLLICVYFYRNNILLTMSYGKATYKDLKLSFEEGCLNRALLYIIAFAAIFALLSIIPKGKTFFTRFGNRTLQVYIFHLIINVVMRENGSLDLIYKETNVFFILAFSVALTFILSLKPFSYPFKFVSKLRFKSKDDSQKDNITVKQ